MALCKGIQYWEDKGLEQGIKQGIKQGREEANMKAAKNMLKRGRMTYEEIAEDAELTVEQVEALAKEVKSELQLA